MRVVDRPPVGGELTDAGGPLSRLLPGRRPLVWSWDAVAGCFTARVGDAILRVRPVSLGRRSWWEGEVAGLRPQPIKVPGPQYGSADPAKAAAVRLVARLLKTA